jgi:crotonobetainyl-CoA:carnitine CoA-transferase CaiB-like acyl-CoA transferase
LVSTSAVPGREFVARGIASARGGANLAAALLQRLGLDYTRLCEVRLVFILASQSSCGDRGSDAGKGGFIGVGQTLSGPASISATPGRPINAAALYVDQAPATRAALIERERSGTGQKISATWCVARTSDEAVAQLHAAGLPAGAILSPQQAIDNSQVTAMGLLQEVDFPGVVRPAPVAELALHFSRSPTGIRSAPPRIGGHSDEILREPGFDDDERIRLRESGVIA